TGGLGVQTDAANLLSMGAREYSPSTGAFLSGDPSQFLGGGPNYYTYVSNQPLQFTDPAGLYAYWYYGPVSWPSDPPSFLSNVSDTLGNAYNAWNSFDSAASKIGGPVYGTAKSILVDLLIHQKLPTLKGIGDTFVAKAIKKAFGKGPLGVFSINTIVTELIKPDMAINIGNGILGIERAHLCGTINGYEAAALVAIGEAPAGCGNAPGIFGPKAPANAAAFGTSAVAGSIDPNDKVGPGFGPDGFVQAGALLPYRVDFENSSTATAPAQEVIVTDQLSSNLDWSSFRITEVGRGNLVLAVPADSQHFQTTVPMTYNGNTFDVLVQIGINLSTGLITAQFFSIDPTTDLPPDVLTGFLPPEDGTGRGMGHFSYTVTPIAGLPTGTQIRNVADVSFDEQPIIATDQVSETDPTQGTDPAKEALVTIDAGPPTSSVAALPPTEASTTFTVSWSGQDDAGGSGIAFYDIYESDNGGPFTLFQSETTAISASFTGQDGHSYGFYSVATDNVGNRGPAPSTAQASTTVVIPAQLTVSNDADSGAGSLRQVLLDANSASGTPHTFLFQLPAGPQAITLLTPLPTATDPLTLSLDATQNVTIVGSSATAWSNNNSLTLSGAGSLVFVGGIDGTGNVVVNAGSNLTANHIIQGNLVIGGTAGSPAIVTIAASDANGNPLNSVAASHTSTTTNAIASFPQPAPPTAGTASAVATASPLTSTTTSS
ncbi:MAG TPA: RHS repeat-associated core domain-containing protein, partial [Pirellulales bacterium]|nr:RHS repeat-associated core domain-containing protein [Pirellulales bacterium]